jgi:pimeloyl-ACP methyl ester carboxylesterase
MPYAPSTFLSLIILILAFFSSSCEQKATEKPTILLLGGTPSTKDILNQLPDSLKKAYHFISFNRPGFGGTEDAPFSKEKLVQLAEQAGFKENDYGIIGISGGAPIAILLADAFKVKHCGIISGMVSNEAYFQYADSTFTKDLFQLVTGPYEPFEKAANFPNIEEIMRQAGTNSPEAAIRASYNELNFLLTPRLFSTLKGHSFPIAWWHGENDRNVAIESVSLFLKDFDNATLHPIPEKDHGIDSRVYIEKLLNEWQHQQAAN